MRIALIAGERTISPTGVAANTGFELCRHGLEAYVDIGDATEVDVVFTKRGNTEDNFSFGPNGWVSDPDDYILSQTRRVMACMYKKGYRYCHFEVSA